MVAVHCALTIIRNCYDIGSQGYCPCESRLRILTAKSGHAHILPPQSAPFRGGRIRAQPYIRFVGPNEFTPQTAFWSVQPFYKAYARNYQTDQINAA